MVDKAEGILTEAFSIQHSAFSDQHVYRLNHATANEVRD